MRAQRSRTFWKRWKTVRLFVVSGKKPSLSFIASRAFTYAGTGEVSKRMHRCVARCGFEGRYVWSTTKTNAPKHGFMLLRRFWCKWSLYPQKVFLSSARALFFEYFTRSVVLFSLNMYWLARCYAIVFWLFFDIWQHRRPRQKTTRYMGL